MNSIHTKKAFREDVRYARDLLRQLEDAVKKGDWEDVADVALNLEPLFSSIRCRATDNHEGIEDFDCKYPDEIEAIREQQEVERARRDSEMIKAIASAQIAKWQEAGENVMRDFFPEPMVISVVTTPSEIVEVKS